ncbi:MAG TPA: type II secretion system F family protein [Candidatus Baltobacteraceae bacterium]|nr:type II secretion system F family protein [Candidatus Baltobacteraceae bacterium]
MIFFGLIAAVAAFVGAALFLLVTMVAGGNPGVTRKLAELEGRSTKRDSKGSVVARMLGGDWQRRTARRLVQAGWYDVTPAQLGMRYLMFGSLGAIAGLAAAIFEHGGLMWVLGALMATGVAASLPNHHLDRAVKARKRGVQLALPNLLDMVATSVQAGIALNGALASAIEAIDGPLAEELRTTLNEIRLGRSRAEALTALAARLAHEDLTTVVTAIVQSERLGGNIAGMLTDLAVESREKRMLRAEEIAAQLPVKMAIPMALFMLPALFLMIFAPVVADFYGGK